MACRHKNARIAAVQMQDYPRCNLAKCDAVVQEATAEVDEWCDRSRDTAWEGFPVHVYFCAARRGPIVASGRFKFSGPADAVKKESLRSATQAAVQSAFQ
ncbi:hypothetical protein [Dactylosporangium sp. NPDC000521]|uniref:hypothetical protein n=1 Tax=Dactylosporangium sp. NPDC000521 TaxID=3363975 RepID=UPI0036AFBB56